MKKNLLIYKNIKVVILAGGLGTRLSELTKTIPKPMVKIGGYPIIIHIINHYLKYGFNNFILSTGYKSNVFRKFFKNYKKDGQEFQAKIFNKNCNINIFDTGIQTMTGGRLKKVKKFLDKDENFMFTYGDGISNVNLHNLVKIYKKKKKIAIVTAVRPPARFGELIIKRNNVIFFKEKPQVRTGWINGGYFMSNYKIFKFIRGDREILEKLPLERLTKQDELSAYKHDGFWKCMDVKRDRDELQKIYKKNKFIF
jgi:glucose-1-phosphate cytidylyltransferase